MYRPSPAKTKLSPSKEISDSPMPLMAEYSPNVCTTFMALLEMS